MGRRLFVLAAAVAALATAVSGPAGAAGGRHAVTVTATEPLCCPLGSTFVASGGIFGTQTSGSFFSEFTQTPLGHSPFTLVRGTDTLTSSLGVITWDFLALCRASTTFPGLVCDGAWHVTSDGASGGGTLHGELNFATFTGTDTFTGVIVDH